MKRVAFFRKYAGGTLRGTLPWGIPAFRHTYVNKYQYLLAKKESGELSILLQLGLPLYLTFWMEICEFHINHPEFSQFQVALHFNTSKKTVWRAYHLLDELFTATPGDR